MTPEIIILGAGPHALVVADILSRNGEYKIVGFLDDVHPEKKGESLRDLPILGGSERLADLRASGVRNAIVGFGHSARRLEAARMLGDYGFDLVAAIHDSSSIGRDSKIGSGTVVKAGAVIDPGVTVGRNVIVGSGVVITHGARVEDGVRIAAGAIVGGNVVLGVASFIGLAATIRNGARVGAHALVGAGSVVLEDVPEGMVAYGVPASVARRVREEDF